MSIAWTSFKMGLFALAVVASIVVIGLVLGFRVGPDHAARYETFFDESVAGLDVGALVQYRGITIGSVDDVQLARDERHVAVSMKVRRKDAHLLAWHRDRDNGLRAQIRAPSLTGTKVVDVDFLDPAEHPVPALPFPAPADYVPSVPSTGIQQSVETVAESVIDTLHRANALLDDVASEEVPQRVAIAVSSVDRTATALRSTVGQVDREKIPTRTADALTRLDTTVDSLHRILQRVDADGGLLTGAERAATSIDTLGLQGAGVTDDLDRTLRDLGGAARTIQSLADAIERDPDMLLKGRERGER